MIRYKAFDPTTCELKASGVAVNGERAREILAIVVGGDLRIECEELPVTVLPQPSHSAP